nr:hypothetical protein [Lacticaseibacillus sharpeae]
MQKITDEEAVALLQQVMQIPTVGQMKPKLRTFWRRRCSHWWMRGLRQLNAYHTRRAGIT